MRTVEWVNGRVKMIDQRELPWTLVHQEYDTYEQVAEAITTMVVRGAPAIGASAAFGMALAAQQSSATDVTALRADLDKAAQVLKAARPTAVNLVWAITRMQETASNPDCDTTEKLRDALREGAQKIADQDVETNKLLAAHGSMLIRDGDVILHHCNTGSLAAVDYGTALGAIRAAHEDGKNVHVILCETRPRLQGARLSAWELKQQGIPFEIIADTAAGYVMQSNEVKAVFVGADRIAANGDVANKIGTYQLGVLAKEHWLPMYVVAPTSTVDMSTPTGREIEIEQRAPEEVRAPYGLKIVPDDYPVRNPAFDVTPNSYVSGIVTEHGIVRAPYFDNLKKIIKQ